MGRWETQPCLLRRRRHTRYTCHERFEVVLQYGVRKKR